MTQDFLRTKWFDDSALGVLLMKVAANEKVIVVIKTSRLFLFNTSSIGALKSKLKAFNKLNDRIKPNIKVNTLGFEYSLRREASNHKATGTKQRFSPLKMRSK